MHSYVVLIRGINVGGKNKLPMAALRTCLEKLGFSRVTTYIASGNVILQSSESADKVKTQIETALLENFAFDSAYIKVLVLAPVQLQAVIDQKPPDFGDQPKVYHSDVVFLIDITAPEAMAVFDPRQGVDTIWAGDGVIYSQRLSSERTKSRLSKIVGTPAYASMTIRTWNTFIKLLELVQTTAQE